MAAIVLGVAFIAGTPLHPARRHRRRGVGARAVLHHVAPLPARALARVPRPGRSTSRTRLPDVAVADRHRVRRRSPASASAPASQVGLPARPTPTSSSPSSPRSSASSACSPCAACSSCLRPRSASQSRCGPPDRFGMLLAGGITAWIADAGVRQHRRRRRAAAAHRPAAAVRVVRRLVAARHDGGRRPAAERRPQRLDDAGRADADDGPLFVDRRRGDGRPRAARRWPWPRPSSTRGHPPSAIHFVGARRGIEATPGARAAGLLRRASSPCGASRARCRRRTSPAFISLIAGRPAGRSRCSGASSPRVVVSVGGYASVPAVLAAKLQRVPVVVVELRRRARARPAGWPPASPRRARWRSRLAAAAPVVTGAPLRPEIVAVDRQRDRRRGPRRARPARRPVRRRSWSAARSARARSTTVIAAFAAARHDRRDLAVRHVVGARNDDGSVARDATRPRGSCTSPVALRGPHGPRLRRRRPGRGPSRRHDGRRAGRARAPSILVPWPLAAEDHQTANARALADVGGAVLVARARARRRPPGRRGRSPRRATPRRWRRWRRGPLASAGADAAAAIARLAEELARRGRRPSSAVDRPAPLDLGRARPLPRRRRRRPGHERHRDRAGRDGPRRLGQRPPRARRCSTGCGPPASTVARRPRRDQRATASTPSPSRPPSRPATPRWTRPAGAGIPVLRRAGMLAAICACARTRRRRRHPRQDDDDVDARA